MKVLSVHLENFASYETLYFDFQDGGLTLIHGATGSGKSTLCDAIPWILFGVTAKNGKADDVLSWNGGETLGSASIELQSKVIQITRSRKPNDLYFRIEDNTDANLTRGKDLNDTQKLINELLGMDADLYLAGAYFHEFSQTAQFFTTTAKNRRAITEQLVDLSLPIRLQEKIKEREKLATTDLTELSNKVFTLSAKLELLSEGVKEAKNCNILWQQDQANRIATIEAKRDGFDASRLQNVKTLESELVEVKYVDPIKYTIKQHYLEANLPVESVPCETCGAPKPNPDRETVIAEINNMKSEISRNSVNLRLHNDLIKRINSLKDQENPYVDQVIEAKAQENPHKDRLIRLQKEVSKQTELLNKANTAASKLRDDKLNLELLSDAVISFRAELISNTIKNLETKTVSHLRDYFEGEISVEFSIQDNDKLEVLIRKDGNECSYTQLSKGQRQMLKLCFGVAVMECIQQHHALELSQLYFDESLDGMDDNNKFKALKLLETLSTKCDSVYIVEHSEGVKAQIDSKYKVELIDGKSVICQA
jgi:DNA repair exonuclease SbcCD ATPase subunit